MRALLWMALAFPLVASAQIYRWTDAQGRVQFGQTPPAGAERVEVRPQVMERDEAVQERLQRTERLFEARRQEQQAAGEKAQRARAERDEHCRRLRHELAQLADGGRFFRTDERGERQYYSETQVESARHYLAGRISRDCGG
ncbi:DUF4124 domain-containing protein [Stutzerimonas nosocomialis]|uniref:DUF4124 domain-containing protein n=1 Tax=Stutzerimonas nosocomialis TaxID=1056496 RepID=UPI001108E08A|nr:DUF4124 domain-containing protein [Stutzerimonas nosocomialis]TLX54709.1 DUF4124 domain-containing protein [Stutzerimonas nosocomialis]TLX58433.1 DUF4124 domain-containing protein [Stutzerimonas nosocomialis]